MVVQGVNTWDILTRILQQFQVHLQCSQLMHQQRQGEAAKAQEEFYRNCSLCTREILHQTGRYLPPAPLQGQEGLPPAAEVGAHPPTPRSTAGLHVTEFPAQGWYSQKGLALAARRGPTTRQNIRQNGSAPARQAPDPPRPREPAVREVGSAQLLHEQPPTATPRAVRRVPPLFREPSQAQLPVAPGSISGSAARVSLAAPGAHVQTAGGVGGGGPLSPAAIRAVSSLRTTGSVGGLVDLVSWCSQGAGVPAQSGFGDLRPRKQSGAATGTRGFRCALLVTSLIVNWVDNQVHYVILQQRGVVFSQELKDKLFVLGALVPSMFQFFGAPSLGSICHF